MGDLIRFPTERRRVEVAKERALKKRRAFSNAKKKKGDRLEKSLGHRKTYMRTGILSDQLTSHMRKVGALDWKTRLEVIDMSIDGDVTEVSVELLEEEPN